MNLKKISLIFLLFFILILFFALDKAPNLPSEAECAFCSQSVLETQKFYEDDLVIALLNYKPAIKGHSLIIPKRHVQSFDELTDEEALQITQVIKKVHLASQKVFGAHSYLLYQKNGKEVGQTVPHVHFHYLPRQKNDDSLIALFLRIATVRFQKKISSQEMESLSNNLKIIGEL